MGLEKTFRELSLSIHKLQDALNALFVTCGDIPNDVSVLADRLEETVLDMKGTIYGARRAAVQARKAVEAPTDLDRARRALTRCQERFHRVEQLFASELASYEKLSDLARLGNERRAWQPWVSTVKLGIEQCREPLEHTSRALAACWGELAERLGMFNISMKATNVGQHIAVPKTKAEDLEVEGVT
jgi:hypothetical protein